MGLKFGPACELLREAVRQPRLGESGVPKIALRPIECRLSGTVTHRELAETGGFICAVTLEGTMSENQIELCIYAEDEDEIERALSVAPVLYRGDGRGVLDMLGERFRAVVSARFDRAGDQALFSELLDMLQDQGCGYPGLEQQIDDALEFMVWQREEKGHTAPLWMSDRSGGTPETEICPNSLKLRAYTGSHVEMSLFYDCAEEAPLKMMVLAQAFFNAGLAAEPKLMMENGFNGLSERSDSRSNLAP